MSLLTKTLLVMKLSAVLILVASLHVAARSTAQKVTYSGKDVDLPTILSVIREQTGYVFFYDKRDLQDINPISVDLKDAPVELALRTILSGQPLDFELQGNTIFITRKTIDRKPAYIVVDAPAPPDTVRGYVRDSTGAPLQGASITIKGTTDGTKTDIKGSFGLIHAKAGSVIIISYTGYTNKEISITSTTHSPMFCHAAKEQRRVGRYRCSGLWHHLPAFQYRVHLHGRCSNHRSAAGDECPAGLAGTGGWAGHHCHQWSARFDRH